MVLATLIMKMSTVKCFSNCFVKMLQNQWSQQHYFSKYYKINRFGYIRWGDVVNHSFSNIVFGNDAKPMVLATCFQKCS